MRVVEHSRTETLETLCAVLLSASSSATHHPPCRASGSARSFAACEAGLHWQGKRKTLLVARAESEADQGRKVFRRATHPVWMVVVVVVVELLVLLLRRREKWQELDFLEGQGG